MNNSPGQNSILRIPLVSILVTLFVVLLGFQVVGPLFGMMIAFPLFPGTMQEFSAAASSPFEYPAFKTSLLIMQGCGTIFGMILIPAVLLKNQNRSLNALFRAPFYAQPAFIIAILVIVFMGFNSIIIQWNQEITLPFGIDEWARAMEKKLGDATEFITKFDSITQFILAFLVVAVLPAIGEEIVFRGMIQNDFHRATGNIHVAVWVSAILFSAIHLQFLGFVPRMLLGALFGYLYFWSGNLWLAVLAHFVNNGFLVVALFLYQKGAFPINLEDTSTPVPWPAVLFSAILSAMLLYAYKTFFNHHPKGDIPA